MREMLTIARREVLQYITTRGFLLGVLLFPLYLYLGAAIPQFIRSSASQATFVVVDPSGTWTPAIDAALARDHAEDTLDAIRDYAKANAEMDAVRGANPDLARLLENEDLNRTQLDAFARAGGWEGVFAALQPHLKPRADSFTAPRAAFVRLETPAAIADAAPDAVAGAVAPFLAGDAFVPSPAGQRELTAALILPTGFGSGPVEQPAEAQILVRGTGAGPLRGFLRRVLADELQTRATVTAGVEAAQARAIADAGVALRRADPTVAPGTDDSTAAALARTFVPLGIAFLILIIVFQYSAMLLSSVVEEKASRLVELILSRTTPLRFMAGKLIGALGLAALTLVIWTAGMFVFLFTFSVNTAEFGDAALSQLWRIEGLWLVLTHAVLAFLLFASAFLAVGSVSRSLTEAQSFLGPLMLVIFIPFAFLSAVGDEPNGTLARMLCLVPVWTPLFMMVRAPHDIPLGEAIGFTVYAIVFVGWVVVQLGRVFERNVLNTDRPPEWSEILARLSPLRRRKPAAA